MSRRGKARGPAPRSLKLPHGEPLPDEPRGAEGWTRTFGGGRPSVDVARSRGVYTAVGYRSARIAEREGRSPSRAGAVAHERIDRLKLQYQSREFVRNNGLYKGMLLRARSYIVENGFKLVAKTGSQKANRQIEHAFREWWKNPDVRGELSGVRLEQMLCDELLTCGGVGVIPVASAKGDRLQLVEAEQIIGQNWLVQGIDRDDTGAVLRYWVSPYDPNTGYPDRSQAKALKPSTFFFVAQFERPSSNREVPPCQAAFPTLHRINDVCDSEALAWQMQARVALLINRTTGPAIAGSVGARKNSNRADDQGDATSNYFTELDYALLFHGKPGEEVKGMERTAPGSNFTDSLTMFFRLLGLPLGLPLELILLDWTHSNYSQSKAVLEQAFQTFIGWQQLLVDSFYKRVFEWWLLRRVAAGEIEWRDDLLEHEWIGPTFPWIDALVEAQAQGEKVDRGFTTHSRVLKTLNSERDEVVEETEREVLDAVQRAQRVQKKAGPGFVIPWEIFCGRKAPAPSSLARVPNAGDKTPDDGGAPPAPVEKPKKSPGSGRATRRREAVR